jgi:glycosyltransferase involved in cell wall biosynthesis
MVQALGIGGTERQVTETARFLNRDRFEPHVACMRAEGLRKQEIEAAGVPMLRLPVTSFLNTSVLTGAGHLRDYIRRHRIRLVHSFDVPMNLFGVPVARLARTPVVLSSQRAHRELTAASGRRLLRVIDRMVDGIVVNCEAMRRHLEEDEGVPARRIEICYNGIDTSTYRPGPAARPPALGDGVVIGVVCALRAEKGLDTLLKAFADVSSEFPSARLAIVGSGREEQALKALAGSLGIAAVTHFEPGTRNVAEWLRCIDIFVLPSLSEALSNSLMEAMACGCCPVASAVGGNPELVLPGETGLLFPPGDSEALSARLRTLLQNEAMRGQFASASAARIVREFTHGAAAARMGEIYDMSLARKTSDSNAAFVAR